MYEKISHKLAHGDTLSDDELLIYLQACKNTYETLSLLGSKFDFYKSHLLKDIFTYSTFAYNRKLCEHTSFYPDHSFTILDKSEAGIRNAKNNDKYIDNKFTNAVEFLRDMGESYKLCYDAAMKILGN